MAIKFITDRKTLISLIQPAMTATSNKSTLPALEGLLFNLERDGVLTVCGYDLEKGVKTSSPVYPKEVGSVILNAQKIYAIIKNMPECEIEINADEKNAVTIKGGASEFTIHGLAAEAFPNLPELLGDRAFTITQGLLKEMINSTIFAVAQIDARPILTGELFQIEENKLTIVALDGARLALREEKNAVFDNKDTFRFVVPGKSLSDLCKLITDNDEMMKVEFTRKHIVFRIGDIIFFSRLLEGEYLDYTRALPQQSKIFVEVERSEFIESVERASLLVDERLKTPLRFRFEDTLLHVYCSTQYGKVNDQVRIKKEGDDLEISFNNRYLLDALRACKDETILASLTGPLTSMMLTPVGHRDSSYIYLVLPCRVKS